MRNRAGARPYPSSATSRKIEARTLGEASPTADRSFLRVRSVRRRARLIGPPAFDDSEDSEVVSLPFDEAITLTLQGGMTHSSRIAGLLIAGNRQGRLL